MTKKTLKKGYHLKLEGEPFKAFEDAPFPDRVAGKPGDFPGVKPKLAVEAGDKVKVGTVLYYDKDNEDIRFTSPASGVVVEIVRGERRAIEAVVVETDGRQTKERINLPKKSISSLTGEEVIPLLLKSGLFPSIIQRPFGKIADPSVTPRDIFISAMNTAPLSPDWNLVVHGNEEAFQAGLDVLARLTSGSVHLTVDKKHRNLSKAFTGARNVELHRFSGPHPAGNVGVHIHHIAPIRGKDDIVWTCSVQTVICIGRFFLKGELSPGTVVAVAGSSAANRKYFRTIRGAEISSFVDNFFDEPVRFISGDVLTGRKIEYDGFMSFYDNMLSIIPEPEHYEFLGWTTMGAQKLSLSRTFLSYYISLLLPRLKFVQKASMNGGKRAFIVSGIYENVLPMDIFPVFLLKSILAEDIEEMEGLGIYEVIEEDLALCEYVDPSKNDIQEILRSGLDLIEREG